MNAKSEQVRIEFAKRQGRQNVAISAAVLLVIVFAILYGRPGLLGANTRTTIFSAQCVVIAGFIGFTVQNWRCPACNRHLGGDLHRRSCGRCKARLR